MYQECPKCKQETLLCVEVADICQNEKCGYHQGYGVYGNVKSDD